MADLVRARVNGAEVTVGKEFADRHNHTILNKPAVGRDGRALEPKFKTTVADAAAKKSTTNPSGGKTATNKEETK